MGQLKELVGNVHTTLKGTLRRYAIIRQVIKSPNRQKADIKISLPCVDFLLYVYSLVLMPMMCLFEALVESCDKHLLGVISRRRFERCKPSAKYLLYFVD